MTIECERADERVCVYCGKVLDECTASSFKESICDECREKYWEKGISP